MSRNNVLRMRYERAIPSSALLSRKLVLSFFVLLSLPLLQSCGKEPAYPTPSFCAAEADCGPNDLIVFANEPWKIVPPETLVPYDSVGLWTVKTDGSDLRFLVGKTPDGRDFLGAPEWSPGGEWIVANDFIGRIWLVSADGDSFVKVTEQGGKFFPTFGPDGKKLAFSTQDSDAVGTRGLRILDLESRTEKSVFPYGTDPSWSPDGGSLVFSGWLLESNGWTEGIIMVDTSGENARMVHREDDVLGGRSASFSPEGEEVVFHMRDEWQVGQVWIVKASGSDPRRLTWKGGQWPSWSADGSEIIYTRIAYNNRTQPGSGDLYVISTDGLMERRLTFFYPR